MLKKIFKIHSPKIPLKSILKSALGILLAIMLAFCLHEFIGFPLIYAPLGASAFLVFVAPTALFAQPANVVFGNIICASIAFLFLKMGLDGFLLSSIATAIAAGLILYLRVPHPPAIGFPIMFSLYHPDGILIFASIIYSSLLLVFIAYFYHKFTKTEYPIMPSKTVL